MSNKKEVENEEHYVKPPSFFEMAKTFTTELATYIKNGAPNVSPEDYKARLDTCKKCEFLIEKTMRCESCGCLLEHKAKWKTTSCPKDKWAPQVVSKEEQESIDKANKAAKEKVAKDLDRNKMFTKNISKNSHRTLSPEEFEELKQKHAKRQEDNSTDSSD